MMARTTMANSGAKTQRTETNLATKARPITTRIAPPNASLPIPRLRCCLSYTACVIFKASSRRTYSARGSSLGPGTEVSMK